MSDAVELQRKEVSGGSDGPHLLITGGVHGDEFESMAAVRRLIARFTPDEARDALCGRLTLVPVVNEGAFLAGARTAEDGLDLARVCPGRSDGTITQRTAVALSTLIRSADFYIDLHSGGVAMSVLPLVGYALHADESILNQQRRMARVFNLPIVWGTSGKLPGRSLSVARDAGVPALYAEYLGSGLCDREGVEAYVEGCLNVMAELEMLTRDQPASRVERVVEDRREGSGHMQVCNPSPLTGFFEPAVQLGDAVGAGDTLGTVCDALGETVHQVESQQAGIVLVLRTFSRVLEGESVAVVLEENG
ncbi:MAG: succinylglutamate desuccinylase [Planctomycetaceae bacterium]|nr:succinylglutamate desuccinylase [Planctomycetaceae bacterium]